MVTPNIVHRLETTDSGLVVGVYGLDYGDEGKGRWTNQMAPYASAILRMNGGTNAGHEVVTEAGKRTLNNFSVGLYHRGCLVVSEVGGSMNFQRGWEEIDMATADGYDRKEILSRILINELTPVTTPLAILLDQKTDFQIVDGQWTSTGNGVKQTFTSIPGRFPIRVRDVAEGGARYRRLVKEYVEKELKFFGRDNLDDASVAEAIAQTYALQDSIGELKDCIVTIGELRKVYREILGENGVILLEAAQSTGLDPNYGQQGDTTSSYCTARHVFGNTQLPRNHRVYVIGVTKVDPTRVGKGALPTQMDEETEARIREVADEYGRRTGRARRVGWTNPINVADSVMVNEPDVIALTKLDVLQGLNGLKILHHYSDENGDRISFPRSNEEQERVVPCFVGLGGYSNVTGITDWKELPPEARAFVKKIEDIMREELEHSGWSDEIPRIGLIGNGPRSDQSIIREEAFQGEKRVLLELFQR